MLTEMEQNKKNAGEAAVDYIKDGTVVGLGSGSTMYWMLKKLGKCVEKGLDIKGVPTSVKTEQLAETFGIPLTTFSEIEQIDLAVDGADEVDEALNLLKGGGGSLVREKIVDAAAKQLVIIVDDSKMVYRLGTFPLPVEVVPFGWELTAANLAKLGCVPQRREVDNEVFVSNNGNYILDCQFPEIINPKQLHDNIKGCVGVVETGLFTDMTDMVIVATKHGTEILTKDK